MLSRSWMNRNYASIKCSLVKHSRVAPVKHCRGFLGTQRRKRARMLIECSCVAGALVTAKGGVNGCMKWKLCDGEEAKCLIVDVGR